MQGDSPPRRGVPQPIRGGPIKFGPFLLEARLAVGGTAEVYLARPTAKLAQSSPDLPARLIVKRLLPHFLNDAEGRTMFEREAALHTAVTHENVVRVFEAGTSDNGEPYLAMEYIDGVDGYRLLRRFRQGASPMPPYLAVHIVREVLRALDSVHTAKDAMGTPMGIIHRDVTPSNLYLSRDGRVKLGDFGIARSAQRATMRNAASAMLKGKIAYLAPEQVAGEPFDHRADLFSTATVLAEMLIGKPLFPGAGQLAILLAIRDCRIDPLREAKGSLPPGLFEILERALQRDPQKRFQTAAELCAALEPFDPHPDATRKELAIQVGRAQTTSSSDAIQAVSQPDGAPKPAATPGAAAAAAPAKPAGPPKQPPPLPARARPKKPPPPPAAAAVLSSSLEPELAPPSPSPPPAAPAPAPAEGSDPPADPGEVTTAQYTGLPSFVVTGQGARFGPWAFARLVEAIATGEVGRGDRVAFMGRDLKPIEDVDDLVRFLPAKTGTTSQLQGPGAPDFHDDLAATSMLEVLLRVLEGQETGVLFAEADQHGRKELYFKNAKLHHVASSNASELLGEYLVRRGKLAREELEIALAVLPRYGGRMGDTLIALGLVGPVDIFRAIREQGRDRVADTFTWGNGKVSFYRGQQAPHVEFPLDLDLPALILAGLEAKEPGDAPLETFKERLDRGLVKGPCDRRGLVRGVKWPPVVAAVMATCSPGPTLLRDVLERTTGGGAARAGDVLRVIEILLAARLLAWT